MIYNPLLQNISELLPLYYLTSFNTIFMIISTTVSRQMITSREPNDNMYKKKTNNYEHRDSTYSIQSLHPRLADLEPNKEKPSE